MQPLPDPSLPWPVPMRAVGICADAEGLRIKAYRCPAGVWTIGRGHTRGVRPGDRCTVEQADRWFLDELTEAANAVLGLCTLHPNPNQLGGMSSMLFNVGEDAFQKSSVLKAHNRGDFAAAARAFGLWNKARVGGVLTELPGLTARRAEEAALYLTPDEDEPPQKMPQAVEPESQPAAGPIASSGAVTAGAGVLVALGDAQTKLGPVGEAIKAGKAFATDTLGLPPEWLLPALLIAAGAVVIHWRLKQRRGGWA